MRDLAPLERAPLLFLGFVALVLGLVGGLARLGIALPAPPTGIGWHGALMASAFFGTLIALERAVALGTLWAYVAPLASGAGGVLLLLGHIGAAFACFVLGSAVFLLASVVIYFRQRAMHTAVLALGAAALVATNIGLAAGADFEALALGWAAFFALTIGGERLELSRLVRPPASARAAFALISATLVALTLVSFWSANVAVRAGGIVLVALAAWFARYDIASRTVRSTGLTRYIALCLLAGYAWLAFGGAVLALSGFDARTLWDAGLHAIMLGFVFSMVFGHAPVILPAVLRITFPYHAALYIPLALLHGALVLRVAGDFVGNDAVRAAGAVGNAAAIALFIVTAASLVISARVSTR